MLTDSQIAELATELTTDPDGLGYAAPLSEGNNAEVRRLINERRADYSVLRPSIPMHEVYANVDWVNEWLNLTDVKREGFRQLTTTTSLDATSANVQQALEEIFGTGSATWANLSSIANRNASRAEDLFGEGTSVTLEDIRAAREV